MYIIVILYSPEVNTMIPEYEYYGTYDEVAGGEIDLEGQIRDFLWVMEMMFDYIESMEKVEEKYLRELEGTSLVLRDVGYDRIANDQSLLESHPQFKDQGLKIIMKYIPLREGYTLSKENETIKWIDYCRAKYTLLYHRDFRERVWNRRVQGIR